MAIAVVGEPPAREMNQGERAADIEKLPYTSKRHTRPLGPFNDDSKSCAVLKAAKSMKNDSASAVTRRSALDARARARDAEGGANSSGSGQVMYDDITPVA
jgi:hypothetical protein